MELLEAIKSHSGHKTSRRLVVPEWGTPAAVDENGKETTPALPLVITYSMVTLDDLALIEELGDVAWPHRAARIVCLKACDEVGVRLFKTVDAPELRQVAAPDVVNRIALAMLGRISQEDAAKK